MVTNLDDAEVSQSGDAPGTLRQAVFDANDLPGPDVISFSSDLTGTIELQFPLLGLVITDSLDIQGPGANQLQLAFTTRHRYLQILGDLTIVSIEDLGLYSPAAPCGPGDNCAHPPLIGSEGKSLTISNSELTGGPWDGINIESGDLNLRNSVVTHFTGTAIESITDGSILIENSEITENKFKGLVINGGVTTIDQTTVADNASFPRGTGTGIQCYFCSLSVRNSLVTGHAAYRGGGLYSRDGVVSIENSTISGNSAQVGGGGVFAFGGNVEIRNSTITHNTTNPQWSSNVGGGIHHRGDSPNGESTLTIENSIVALNNQQLLRPPAVRDIRVAGDVLFEISHSLIGDVTGSNLSESPQPTENGNLLGGPIHGSLDPRLGPLAYNGGPTLTHALLPDSPAVDAAMGFNELGEFDQRGTAFARVFNGTPDMGSFELQAMAGDFDGDYVVGCDEVDQLAAAIFGGMGPIETFDLNEDNLVDGQDMEVLFASIATHRLHSRDRLLSGDANLDGAVDGSDFNIWANNRFAKVSGSCQADFNLDGIVDASDLSIWSENRFRSLNDDSRDAPVPDEAPAEQNDHRARRSPWKQKATKRRMI